MTVRTWFRLLRRSAYESDPPPIYARFRAEYPVEILGEPSYAPVGPVVMLITFGDYLRLIEQGTPEPVKSSRHGLWVYQ